jgi:transcription termination factor NusB
MMDGGDTQMKNDEALLALVRVVIDRLQALDERITENLQRDSSILEIIEAVTTRVEALEAAVIAVPRGSKPQ